MAPNAEEELLVVKPWGPQPEKERLRPPTYNAEDYAIALRRWGRRPLGTVQDSQGTLPSTTSSSSGYASGCGEMTLRQFTSVSELLNKLRADLRLAFPSFVQEFASPPADGITLLLETLRGVQLAQSSPPSSGHTGPRLGTRRAALDELGCVECLAACGERCADAPRLLVEAQPGLLALAVCLTSSLNRSRVLALQLLTKVCQTPGGHAAVSEAVSTLRLRYGEGGRFRFLAGALLAPRAAIALRVAGVAFLNAFLKSAPRTQTRLYIQAEACEAGLEPEVLEEWLREFDDREEDSLTELLHKEVQKWSNNCVDVDALQRRALRAEETCRILSKKVSALQNQLQKFQLDKMNSYHLDDRQKSSIDVTKTPKLSSNAEDEGISSSERSSTPEDTKPRHRIQVIQDNDQETTIDDVIEELRIIVKDAEEEFSEKNQEERHQETITTPEFSTKNILFRTNSKNSSNFSESLTAERIHHRVEAKCFKSKGDSSAPQNREKSEQVTYFGTDRDCSTDSSATRRLSSHGTRKISRSSAEGSVRIVVKGPEVEEAIVPAILHPQPPRRSPPCLSAIMVARRCDVIDHEEPYNSPDDEVDDETLGDGSDSLLSASRLKYSGKVHGEQSNPVQHPQKLLINDGLVTSHKETVEKLRKSFDDVRDPSGILQDGPEKIEWDRKTTRNHDGSKKATPTSGQLGECQTAVHRYGTRYKSEVEKRKHLRRSASHDYLESSASSPRSRRSALGRVECRIRKFESLNSFDEQRSLRGYRLGSSENLNRQPGHFDDVSRSRMRRSESFHHVSHVAKRDQASSNGGSDSGLFYITDYNLDPLDARRARSIEAPRSPNLLTKSLDRIDEGLDSMVDIVITEERNQWNRYEKSKKLRQEDKPRSRTKSKKNDDVYGGDIGGEQLRSDELYEDQRHQPWDYQNELNSPRKNGDMDCDVRIISKPAARHSSFCQNDNKFSNRPNDTGIFAGRTYDTFGLGKSRFNAGKYSGNHPTKENLLGRRNTTSALIGQRGKVTDVISGLY